MKKTGLMIISGLLAVSATQALTEVQKKTDYIRTFDKDADGKLTIEEYTEMTRVQFEKKKNTADYKAEAAKRFKNTDTDKDGFVTPEEIIRQLVKVGYLPADADTGLPEDAKTTGNVE